MNSDFDGFSWSRFVQRQICTASIQFSMFKTDAATDLISGSSERWAWRQCSISFSSVTPGAPDLSDRGSAAFGLPDHQQYDFAAKASSDKWAYLFLSLWRYNYYNAVADIFNFLSSFGFLLSPSLHIQSSQADWELTTNAALLSSSRV